MQFTLPPLIIEQPLVLLRGSTSLLYGLAGQLL